MRLKQLLGLRVIDPIAARSVGTVVDYELDPASHRVAAVQLSRADAADDGRVPGEHIRRVGRDAIMLTAQSRGSSPRAAPAADERWLDSASVDGLEVLGDDGKRIGYLTDATFDEDSLVIGDYLLRSSFWERLVGRRGRVQPRSVRSCSRELMLVTTGPVEETAPALETVSDGQRVPARAE